MSNIRFFKTFIAVAEYGSFAAAADRVALTNAAVGQQMRALEEEMRRPLFDRSQRQVKLSRDGVLLLPKAKRGYYLEYTVRTPGARDRGARRIVCGGRPRTPDACYYTNDHYASFQEIKE